MSLRADLEIISGWIREKSRVLDLGCGDGALLAYLRDHREARGYGLEIDNDNIAKCIAHGINVMQVDLDEGLADFEDRSFDYVVMTQTLQAVRYPARLLEEMLRVGREGIITFPNVGHWQNRLQMLVRGAMPITRALPHEWYNTPNIHLCSLADFETLCRRKNIAIAQRTVVDYAHRASAGINWWPNFFGEIALYRVQRQA